MNILDQNPNAAVRHSLRFRRVSTRYPRRVAEAYGGDLARAAADTDEQVAAAVATWEQAGGIPTRDWRRIGAEEKRGGTVVHLPQLDARRRTELLRALNAVPISVSYAAGIGLGTARLRPQPPGASSRARAAAPQLARTGRRRRSPCLEDVTP